MQNNINFFFSFGRPNFWGAGGGPTWLGQLPKFFQKLDLKASLTRRYKAGNLDGFADCTESASQRQESKNRKLGANPKTFTEAEEKRITRAIEENESIVKVAKEMGRTYRSILAKMWRRKQAMTTVSKGRFSAEEDSRTRLAVENGEDYRKVTRKFEIS